MKKWILLLLLILVPTAFAGITDEAKYLLNNRMGSVGAKVQLGTLIDNTTRVAQVDYSYAVDGGAIGTINLGEVLPVNAIIKKCWFDVLTAFVSESGGGTIALGSESSGDLKAVVDADTLSGRVDCIPTGSAANMIKLTAARQLTISIASEVMTAGKLKLFVEYVVSE